MARPLTAAMLTEIVKPLLHHPFYLVELDFPSGFVRLTDRAIDVSFGGNTYLGNGDLLGVGPIEETIDVVASGFVVTLSGNRASLRSTVLTDYYQGRSAKVWFGLVDPTDRSISVVDPELVADDFLEGVEIDDSEDWPTISVHVEGDLRDLGFGRERRWSDEDQKDLFPGDTGLRYMEAVQDFNIRASSL